MLCSILYYFFTTVGLVFTIYHTYKAISYVFRLLICQKVPENLFKYGTWAVITGGSSGLGRGYAIELAKRGHNLYLISNEEEKLKELCAHLEKEYFIKAQYFYFDFSSTDYTPLKNDLMNKNWIHDLGILINNVGIAPYNGSYLVNSRMRPHQTSVNQLAAGININCLSQCAMTAMVLPIFEEKKTGLIVQMSSLAGTTILHGGALYSATKVFNLFFNTAMAKELQHQCPGIETITIQPYFVL